MINKILKQGVDHQDTIDILLKQAGAGWTLKQLQDKGYIEIDDDKFVLTAEGKKEVVKYAIEQSKKNKEKWDKQQDKNK